MSLTSGALSSSRTILELWRTAASGPRLSSDTRVKKLPGSPTIWIWSGMEIVLAPLIITPGQVSEQLLFYRWDVLVVIWVTLEES